MVPTPIGRVERPEIGFKKTDKPRRFVLLDVENQKPVAVPEPAAHVAMMLLPLAAPVIGDRFGREAKCVGIALLPSAIRGAAGF